LKEAKQSLLSLGWAASQFGVLCVVGLLGGLWIDRKIGTLPLIGLVGLGLGFFAGIRILIAVVKSAKKVDPNE